MRQGFPQNGRLSSVAALAILLLVSLPAGWARPAQSPDDVRHLMADWLLHHSVYVRHAYRGSVLHFDDEGRLINHVTPGFWSDTGAVYPTKIELGSTGMLHVEAVREVAVFNHGKSRWETIRRNDYPIVIEIQFSPAAMTPDHVRHVLETIFARDVKEIASEVPDYWRPCLSGTMVKYEPQARDFCFDPGVPVDFDHYAPVRTQAAHIDDRTRQPRAIKTVKPKFTDASRELRFNGASVLWVVVDEQGLPAEIYVASPVGYGLDDQAVIAVANWKFEPGRINGKPVRAQMTIEVAFHVPLHNLRVPKIKW